MSQNAVTTASLPPEDASNKVVMTTAIRALIECHMHDVKVFDSAAIRAEADANTKLNTMDYPAANARVIEHRQLARGEMAALVLLVRHQYPTLSLEQRCDVIQSNTSLTSDDVNRIWNALLAVTA